MNSPEPHTVAGEHPVGALTWRRYLQGISYGILCGMIWGSVMTAYVGWGYTQDAITVVSEISMTFVLGLPYGFAFGVTFVKMRKRLPTDSIFVKTLVLSFLGWFVWELVNIGASGFSMLMYQVGELDLISLLILLVSGLLFGYMFNRRPLIAGPIAESLPVKRPLNVKDQDRPLKVRHQERRRELPDIVRYPIYLGFRLSVVAAFLYVIGATSISSIMQLSFLQTRDLYVILHRFYSAFFAVSVIGIVYRFAANRWVQGEWREAIETLPYPIEDVTAAVDFMVRKNEWNAQIRNISSDFTEASFKVIIPWELFRYKKVVFVLLKDTGGKATEFYIYSGCASMVDWGQNQNVIINFIVELEKAIKANTSV